MTLPTSQSSPSEASTISVRQATRRDESAIARFLSQAYPDRHAFKYPDRWRWQFLQNPFWNGDDLPIWLAWHDEAIVGQTCALIEQLQGNGRTLQLGWSVDTVVLPEYRGLGVGKQLQAANQAAHEVFMSLSMSPENRRIKERLGGSTWPPVQALALQIEVEPEALARRCGRAASWPGVGAACRAAADIVSRMQRQRAARRCSSVIRSRSLEMVPITALDRELTDFCESTSRGYGVCVPRDRRWLEWKIMRQPHGDRECFAVREGNRLVGFLAVRHGSEAERGTSTILELLVPSDSPHLAAINALATRHLLDKGARRIRVMGSSVGHLAALTSLGYSVTRDYAAVCYYADESLAIVPTGIPYFSYADQDLDQVGQA